jgi:hypothetical protein
VACEPIAKSVRDNELLGRILCRYQGSIVQRTCLIFEMRKKSFVDCIIMEVAWQCLMGTIEQPVQVEADSFTSQNPATPWLIVQVELGSYRQQCRRVWLAERIATDVQVFSGAVRMLWSDWDVAEEKRNGVANLGWSQYP